VKERPILFSGEMVRAILAGRKTQTRRVVKPQPPCGCEYVIDGANSHALCRTIERPEVWVPPTGKSVDHRLPCPYGQLGDRLWVKEGHYYRKFLPYATSNDVVYRADHVGTSHPPMGVGRPWRPSIHMHRWASRITLEIVAVRVERLSAISGADALAEGVSLTDFWTPKELNSRPFEEKWWDDCHFWNNYPQIAYRRLWESINGAGSWEKNPWVWVIEFRKVPAPDASCLAPSK
jgi:hypothetical protein